MEISVNRWTSDTCNSFYIFFQIRKKTSASDDRPSATAVGYVGLASMIVSLSLVALLDITTLLRDLRMLADNVRNVFQQWLRWIVEEIKPFFGTLISMWKIFLQNSCLGQIAHVHVYKYLMYSHFVLITLPFWPSACISYRFFLMYLYANIDDSDPDSASYLGL